MGDLRCSTSFFWWVRGQKFGPGSYNRPHIHKLNVSIFGYCIYIPIAYSFWMRRISHYEILYSSKFKKVTPLSLEMNTLF